MKGLKITLKAITVITTLMIFVFIMASRVEKEMHGAPFSERPVVYILSILGIIYLIRGIIRYIKWLSS